MKREYGLFLFVLLSNIWIWKLAFISYFSAFVAVCVTYLLWRRVQQKKGSIILLVAASVVLSFVYLNTTTVKSLTLLDNDEQRIKSMRLKEYPPVRVNLLSKTFWVPIGHWFEGRSETIAFFRMQKNFFENIDPNLYFFSNHPRERVGVKEIEKFPYIFLPFFLTGIYILTKKVAVNLYALFTLLIITILGSVNPAGPFIIFPLIVCYIACGLGYFLKFIDKLPLKKRKIIWVVNTFVFVLAFYQHIANAI